MGIRRSGRNRNILPVLFLTVLFLLYRYTGTSKLITSGSVIVKMPDSNDVISKLAVSVRRVSSFPPKLALAVTNTNSDPVTILIWNSPLDPLALQLGLVAFVPAESDNDGPIQMPKIQIRRKMPPGPESLVTIGAGQTREQELELKEPIVPLEKLRGRAFSVICRGEWIGVWLSEADGVSKASLEKAGASEDSFRGSFESEAFEVEL